MDSCVFCMYVLESTNTVILVDIFSQKKQILTNIAIRENLRLNLR